MTISNQAVFNKIIAECHQAMEHESNVREHARAIQTLTELLTEDKSHTSVAGTRPSSVEPAMNQAEMQQMMGDLPRTHDKKNAKQPSTSREEEANGDSIFDF
ncbi:hypothetical protein J416_03836 [Gracilibacillus halophilus YIM-C55.5]|uniref:YwdI family protein n=1 Tax=Gracilibacillus halophilus YIM-C55.5 TaxID=1308866 RepID=N4WEJ3_9BACI|nr:YwdI family protein [Gracilibacillus halophilus]ENH97669.1 hypothetical protein J416_03836 [Gracilibacillus halophilus YIM-C55.5]